MKLKKVFSNLRYIIRKLWKVSKSFVILRTISAVITGISTTAVVHLVKLLVENIFSLKMVESLFTIAYLVLLELCVSISTKYIEKRTSLTYDLFRNELKFDLYKKTVEMDYEILSSPSTIDKKELALIAINKNFGTKYIDCMFSTISALITIVSLFYILSIVSWWVVFIVAIIILLRVVTILIQKKVVYNTQVDMAPINKEISYYMNIMGDSNYANEMRMHPIASWLIKKYRKTIAKINNLYSKLNNFNFMSNILLRGLTIIEQSLYYFFLALQVIYHGLSYAEFSMFLAAMKSISAQITNVFKNVIDIIDSAMYVDAYKDFMEIKNNIAVSNVGINVSEIKDKNMIYSIENVYFKYPGSNRYVFENLNIEIESKKLYVVVGKNGSGKSTLCKLICRLYDVENGKIRFNGIDIRDIEYSGYRSKIGVAFQDYKYYEMTIAENIAMDSYDSTDAVRNKILMCLEIVGLKDKIVSMPNGIDTMLGRLFDNDGILLSGGEIQKIALAKVIFMNSPVIILDEPSSSMDAIAENDLLQTVINVTKEKTVFYISHRLSVAKYADAVIFLDDGKISGFGKHEYLMNSNIKYAEMYSSQARHYL